MNEYSLIPEHLREGLNRWLTEGILPGSFLRAVLRNDLAQAVLRADEISLAALPDLIKWLIHFAPEGSYGSAKVFSQWPMFLRAKANQEQSNG